MRDAEALTDLFRSRGLKVTPQRRRIFEVLFANPSHPTADAVYQRVSAEMPTISLKTVYQTLNDLVVLGELQQLRIDAGANRFDPNTGVHHHLVCSRCGQVRDLHAEGLDPAVPEGRPHGFTITSAEVTYRGLCATCGASTDGG